MLPVRVLPVRVLPVQVQAFELESSCWRWSWGWRAFLAILSNKSVSLYSYFNNSTSAYSQLYTRCRARVWQECKGSSVELAERRCGSCFLFWSSCSRSCSNFGTSCIFVRGLLLMQTSTGSTAPCFARGVCQPQTSGADGSLIDRPSSIVSSAVLRVHNVYRLDL